MSKPNSRTNQKMTNDKFWQFRNLAGDDQKAELQLGIPADKDYTESGKKRWKPNEKLATLSSPSGSAMHHTVWEMQEQTVEQMLQQNTERRVRQLIANAKRKGVI